MSGNNTVTYTIQVPGATATKAIGEDVAAVTELLYEVYLTEATAEDQYDAKETWLYDGQATISNGTATINLELVNNQNFRVLFWAQVSGTGIYDTENLKAVKMSTALNANQESYAAFSGSDYIKYGDNLLGRTVTLYRPVSQVNIATTAESLTLGEDENGANAQTTISFKETGVTVTGLSTTYNIATGAPATDNTEFTYAAKPVSLSESTIKVNNVDYTYVGMNYVGFAPVTGDNVEVSYTITTNEVGVITNTIDNVPVKPNYRTNIIGNLITSTSDYTITLSKEWGGEYYGPEFVEEPAFDEQSKTYTITNAYQLRWVAQQVNEKKNSFDGYTIQLAADIDLKNQPWEPIGSSTYFQGIFEGVVLSKAANDYPTISNLYMKDAPMRSGLFGTIAGNATLRNFNLKGVNISGERQIGAVVGRAYPCLITNVNVEDVNITLVPSFDGTKYDNGDKAGGIVGFTDEGVNIVGCSVKNATFKAYRDMGGIIGTTQNGYASIIKDNAVENLTFIVTASYTPYDKNTLPGAYDPIRGGTRSNANDQITDNNVGTVKVENHVEIEDKDSFLEALKKPNAVVSVPEETTIELPAGLNLSGQQSGTVTIVGAGESSVLKGLVGSGNNPGNYANGLDLVFKDITYQSAGGYSGGFGHAKSVTFINCKIVGEMYAQSWAPHYFIDCDIDPLNGYIYTWNSNCEFKGCTFNASEGKALQVFGDGPYHTNVLIEDCKFIASKWAYTYPGTPDQGKPVTGIDINSANGFKVDVTVTNCTTTGFPTGLNSGSDLYNVKDGGVGKVNLIIDGVQVVRAGYTQLAGFPNVWVKDGAYYVFDKAGLADLNAYFVKNWCGNDTWNHTYNIGADIDATGFTWNSVWLNVGSNDNNGLVLDGNGHTISNMTINGSMFTGTPAGGNPGTTPGYVKNITVDNAIVTGDHWTAVFWGHTYSDMIYENVVVKNTSVTGNCNVAVLLGGTASDNAATTDCAITFKNCSVLNCKVTANGKSDQDPTGASAYCARAIGKSSIIFVENNIIDNATTITNNNGLIGGRVYGYTTIHNGNWAGTGACDSFTDFGGLEFVNTPDALTDALEKGANVTLTEDVKTVSSTTAPYGNKYAFKMDGGVLDGQGNELQMDCYGDDYGIMTSGGTVKNLTIKQGCRAVMIMYPTQDVILDNVNIGGDGVLYTINTGESGSAGVKLIVTNSTLAGWTSFGDAIASASFTNVKFEQGTYYDNIYGRVFKPYVTTVVTDCSFVEHMNLDLSELRNGHKVTFKNCTVGGQTLTAGIITLPSTDAQYDTELFTVDLPGWASSLADCVVFE